VSEPVQSGLHGAVLIGPGYPVCKVGAPCTRPAGNVWLVFTRRGRAARTRTATNGAYQIALAPGTYAVSSPKHLGGGLSPRRVTVRRGNYRRVVFTLDIGIR
jgi:hypothetical protein